MSLEELRIISKRVFEDSVARILLNNSNITPVQFETLVIEAFSREKQLSDRNLRLLLRSDGRPLSRGAFNRTLAQCKRNILESIYTLFLLGYVGLFDSIKLEPFLELGNQLQSIMEMPSVGLNESSGRAVMAFVDRVKSFAEKLAVRPLSET